MARNERGFVVFSGLLVLAGSILSINGGRQHPSIGPHMGTYGSDAFFKEFAKLMMDPSWQPSHWQILFGPILWCLGAFGLLLIARRAGEKLWTPMGYVALALGTALYTVTYIGDGFVAPRIGEKLLATQDPELAAAITQVFASIQWFTIKISLPSWMLVAFGTSLLSIGLWAVGRTYSGFNRKMTIFIAAAGLVIGAWSFFAWAIGAYSPGPMVSELWLPAVIATNTWYVQLGIGLIVHGLAQPDRPRPARARRRPGQQHAQAEQIQPEPERIS
jgi:hypothetical protein